MKQDPFSGYRALTPKEMAEKLMNPNIPKTEAEHWAVREIEKQRAENERLRAKIKWLIEDDERLHSVLYRIANPPPFADCPVEMAQNATRGEHLRREAFDGIRRALEDKP